MRPGGPESGRVGVWPRAFLLQVGDSRCYIFKDDRLTQLSRDQTMAEEMARIGALKRDDIQRSPLSNILSSALGGQEATPVITRVDTGLPGNGNKGHRYGTDLPAADKDDLLEYLKTL